jgi:hypothetical protein
VPVPATQLNCHECFIYSEYICLSFKNNKSDERERLRLTDKAATKKTKVNIHPVPGLSNPAPLKNNFLL